MTTTLPCCGRSEDTVLTADVIEPGKLYRCRCRCGAVVDLTIDGAATIHTPAPVRGGALSRFIQTPVLS